MPSRRAAADGHRHVRIPGSSPARGDALTRRTRLLGAATIAYGVGEAIIALTAGTLSAVLLLGLLANSLYGCSRADPVAALVIAAVAVKEGRDARHGKGSCAPPPAAVDGVAPAAGARDSGCRD
ncbi:hypothetical protein [Streptomyces sp. NPDC085479]|uniref:hypothetical protein n=1 Tax=Streptomyces sp. NPDC085479 TaxID=3365726 RepID=UPI0037D585BB